MVEIDLKRQVSDEYHAINNEWMGVHFRLLFYYTLVSGISEILMFIVIKATNSLTCSVGEYWLKYVMVPFLLNVCVVSVGYVIFKRKKVSVEAKQYIISILFVLLAFILQLMHSGFVAILVVSIFPILMTIMYEKQKLTTIIAICTGVLQFVSGYFVFWDPEKVVNSAYLINLIVLLITTFCTWLTCRHMINFMKMKRKIIIENDIERFHLQSKINIDDLTKVGNKLALMNRLDIESASFKGVEYLAMIDLDDFKKINDTCGHVFGDDVLRCLGEALINVQTGAEAFRYGGDEFCVVFTDKSITNVLYELKNIQTYLNDHVEVPNKGTKVLISIGVASYTKGKSITELLKQADEALYESKTNDREKITVYNFLK